MTAVMPLQVPFDGWTVEDMPELEGPCELVDGGLLMTPPGSPRHQEMAMALAIAMQPALPREWRATAPQGSLRRPQLPGAGRAGLRPCCCRSRADLAAERAPGGRGDEPGQRQHRPGRQAGAVRRSWHPVLLRLELEPLVLVVHRLVGDAYDVVGRFDDEVQLDEPVSVSFPLASLLA